MVEMGTRTLAAANDADGRVLVREYKTYPKGSRWVPKGYTQHVKTYVFRSDAASADWLRQQQAAWDSWQARKVTDRMKRQMPHSLKVGDILYSSWGYDQTNISFYVVTRTTGHYVWLRGLAQDGTETGFMAGTCRPATPLQPTGEEHKHKASSSGSVALSSYEHASLWDGRPKHYTAYA
jgi:hypothetical protein